MKKKEIFFLVSVSTILLTAVASSQEDHHLVKTDRGCSASYFVGELIIVYYTPNEGEEFQLQFYDAVMNEGLLAEGVGDGLTHEITVPAEFPPGPLTFFLRMPCDRDCELCDMCDYGHCTVIIEKQDPCKDHCTNGIQDCGEYGVDCGGGCPVVDQDKDGVEDCVDKCPDSRCGRVDDEGCETDRDGDGIKDCEDKCPYSKGSSITRGCPFNFWIVGGIACIAVGGGLVLWKLKGRK